MGPFAVVILKKKLVGSIGLLWDSCDIQRPAQNCGKCPFHDSGRLSRVQKQECEKCYECFSHHLEKLEVSKDDCCRLKTLPSGNLTIKIIKIDIFYSEWK